VERPDARTTLRVEPPYADRVHRRKTLQMDPADIERAAAATAPARTRFARASTANAGADPMVAAFADLSDVPRLLPFRARRPILATIIAAAFTAALILVLHHVA
jgi:hypothetical protein